MWLRLDGIDRRPLWYDEAATRLAVAGRPETALRAWYDGRMLRAADLTAGRAGGSIATDADPAIDGAAAVAGSAVAVAAAVLANEPQSGPLYFVAARVWTALAGDSLAALRAFSALASVAALGLAYAVARALFADGGAALATTALVAVSPLHLRYAQEARPYALWSAVLLLAVLATVRASRGGRARAWALVTATYGAALLVHPLSLLVFPACAALARGERRWWYAAGGAIVVWSPWAALAWRGRDVLAATTAWTSEPSGPAALVRAWCGIATSVFLRPGGEGGLVAALPAGPVATVLWALAGVAAVALAAVALLGLGRTEVAAPARRFVRRLVVVPWGALALADVVLGGRRSTVARYLVPGWIGLELAVGRWLGAPRACPAAPSTTGTGALVAVLALGLGSALATRGAAYWWDTDAARLRALGTAAAVAAAVPAAIVVTDAPPLVAIELASRLEPGTSLRLGADAAHAIAPAEWPRVVVLLPTPALRAALARRLGPDRALVPAEGAGGAWRVGSPGG